MTTTAPQTDRADIEVLARELTDAGWSAFSLAADICGVDPRTRADVEAMLSIERLGLVAPSAHHKPARYYLTTLGRALLAYLDEVWARLLPSDRLALRNAPLRSEGRTAGLVAEGTLLVRLYTREGCRIEVTPLGRAVLKRAKDTGRA